MKHNWKQLENDLRLGSQSALARSISLVENEAPGYDEFLQQLSPGKTKIIGITGPPGAGKSTLVDALLEQWIQEGKKVAVICVDPSSPFHHGAVLGDRIRMSRWYDHPLVYIRSLATRGSLGGLHPKIIEITDILKAAAFDLVIIETVGVGQTEIEIAALADTTVVVLVPEAGDEVQTMKAGLMEIADIFVVNKADRPDADLFVKNLQQMLAPAFSKNYYEAQVIKTVAIRQSGITDLHQAIDHHLQKLHVNDKKNDLLTEKAFYLIQQKRMKDVDRSVLKKEIASARMAGSFNLYNFIANK
jgi:LAO/AO transport system kinase